MWTLGYSPSTKRKTLYHHLTRLNSALLGPWATGRLRVSSHYPASTTTSAANVPTTTKSAGDQRKGSGPIHSGEKARASAATTT